MIQSEGHVWPAFVALAKDVTRRRWKPATAAHYCRGFRFDAWSNAPYAGGIKIGEAVCTCDTYLQPLREMPDDHYQREGFAWLREHPQCLPKAAKRELWAQGNCSFDAFDRWRWSGGELYVCEFKIDLITDAGFQLLESLLNPPAKAGELF